MPIEFPYPAPAAGAQRLPALSRLLASPLVLGAAMVALLLVTLSGGWLFVERMAVFGRQQELEDFATLASAAAGALDPQLIAQLQGSRADEGTQPHDRVRSRLQQVRKAIPNSRFVYLVTLRNQQIVFLADAESPDSPDYSPPGQVYSEAPPAFRQAFSSQRPAAYGPYQDRWGTWVTGIAAIPQVSGDPVLAAIGIDVSAERYQAIITNFRNFAWAITGLIAVIVALAMTLLWLMWRYSTRLRAQLDEINRAQESLRLAAAVIENSTEGVMVTNEKLQIESVNPAFERITGYSTDQAMGRTPKILFSGKHDDSFFKHLREVVDTQGHWRGEIWNRRRSGELYPQQTAINVLRDANGRVTHYASVFSDNSVQHELEAKLREMSWVDGLTRVGNRRLFDEALAREWARSLRDGQPLSLLMIDIDFFKAYNDQYGHLEGDRCLQAVAKAIQHSASRASDVVTRYGGEEFAVILTAANARTASTMGERIRSNVEALALPHDTSKAGPVVTISVGAATTVPLLPSRQAELISAADQALYQAKRTGRNRVVSAAEAAAA